MLNNYNDPKVWKIFQEGKTKGIFQLESGTGKTWSKKLRPSKMEEGVALVSLIRPGCMNAMTEGKSMAQHYVDRKNGIDEVKYLHPSLEDILNVTYGVIVYQEQVMRISQKLASFTLEEADDLRKAIGKKKADLMNKVKTKFIEGCIKVGMVPDDVAKEIFSWIEKSARYLFNKSHALCYAVNAYNSAHEKVYHTTKFFTSYLTFASEKQDPHEEVSELVSEAKLFDIEFVLPKLSFFSLDFKQIGDRKILFGIKSIKSLTGVTGDKLFELLNNLDVKDKNGDKKPLSQYSWMDILIYVSTQINATAFKALCYAGFFCFNNNGLTRNRAIYEYKIFSSLTDAELKWIKNQYPTKQWNNLESCLQDLAPTKKMGGGTSKVERMQAINNEIGFLKEPPYSLEDTPAWIVAQEKKLFGCPISISSIESSDTSAANTTCKEISNGKSGKFLCVAATIKKITTCKVKNGKSKGELMSFLTIEDESCVLDNVVVFPMTRKQYEYCLYEGNNLLICGLVNKDKPGLIVEKVYEI
jgi:DNA polymerase-3 subunit alpha